MKIRKLSLIAILTLGSFLAFGTFTQAQDAQPKNQKTGQRAGKQGDALAQMTKQLGLTEAQQATLKPILTERTEKMKELRAKTELTQEERRTKMQELTKTYDTKITKVLTDEQKKKYEEARTQARAKARKKNA